MDDPRFEQFFRDPTHPLHRRYEAVRAVVFERQSLQAVAERFGFAYGTLRNLVCQFRRHIRSGQMPPFFSIRRADGLLASADSAPPREPICRPSPIADACPRSTNIPVPHASLVCFCSCPCSANSALIASSSRLAILAREAFPPAAPCSAC